MPHRSACLIAVAAIALTSCHRGGTKQDGGTGGVDTGAGSSDGAPAPQPFVIEIGFDACSIAAETVDFIDPASGAVLDDVPAAWTGCSMVWTAADIDGTNGYLRLELSTALPEFDPNYPGPRWLTIEAPLDLEDPGTFNAFTPTSGSWPHGSPVIYVDTDSPSAAGETDPEDTAGVGFRRGANWAEATGMVEVASAVGDVVCAGENVDNGGNLDIELDLSGLALTLVDGRQAATRGSFAVGGSQACEPVVADGDDGDGGGDDGPAGDCTRRMPAGNDTNYEPIDVDVLRDLPNGLVFSDVYVLSTSACNARADCEESNREEFKLTLRRPPGEAWTATQHFVEGPDAELTWGIEAVGCEPKSETVTNMSTGLMFESYQLWFHQADGDGPVGIDHTNVQLQKGVASDPLASPNEMAVEQLFVPSYEAALNYSYVPLLQ